MSTSSAACKTVLVVDDDEDLQSAVLDLLLAEGFAAEGAENGAIALERIRTSGMPDLILLDMRMPVMNGWDFARVFRERHDHKAPIVVVTAAADARRWATEVGAEGWLCKPFEAKDLFAAIRRLAKTSQA